MSGSGEIFVRVPDDEGIEPEIERAMKVQRMVIPSDQEFERYIPASIQNQPAEIREILKVISPAFRKLDFVINWLHYNNYVARQTEAEKIRREGWFPKVVSSFGYMSIGGAAVALGEAIFKFVSTGHIQ